MKTVTVEDLRRERLANNLEHYRAELERLVKAGQFEAAAMARELARKAQTDLRHMDGLCGECGRPRVRP